MENPIKISIVLAVYNGALYLKDAIESVLQQTYRDFEFIIINDGSTDTTAEIVLSYDDNRIIYIENEFNRGLIYSLNRGLSESKGKYIARMDADDIALPQRLQVQYDFMETHTEIGICGANIETFYEGIPGNRIVKFPEMDKKIRAYTFFQSPFCHPTVMMRKELIDKNQIRYPKDFFRAEDYALWIKILQYTQAYNIQSVLLRYRKHEGSETSITDREKKKNWNASRIQGLYIQQNRITMAPDDLFPFSCFVNRSIDYPLTRDNQQLFDRILKDFFSQLSEKQKSLYSIAIEFVATACFYRFFKSKEIPKTPYLWKLYFRGVFSFLKKSPIFVKRIIQRS